MYINGHAVAHTSKYNIIKLNSLTCVQEALFPAWFWIFFFPFFYIFQPDGSSTQILGLLTSRSETKLKGKILNAEEVRCQLPPTLRYQIRVQQELAYFLSYLIYYYQESSDTSSQSQLRSLAHVHRDL